MVEGEVVQLSTLGRMDLGEQEVIELAARKTACLFSGCARLGAVLGQLSATPKSRRWPTTGATRAWPSSLVDDLLDFTASPTQLGKPVLSDLKEGKVTLPLIYALEARRTTARRAGAWCAPCSRKRAFTACARRKFPRWCAIPARSTARGCWLTNMPAAPRLPERRAPTPNLAARSFAVPDFILDRER